MLHDVDIGTGSPPRLKVAILIVAIFCSSVYSAERVESNGDEEECIFDQDAQDAAYRELEKKYPGSRYLEHEYKLIILVGGDQITLRRGGCVHFGISIELRSSKTGEYDDEAVFTAKVMDLVTEYGQDLIRPDMLEKSINAENRHVTKNDSGVYYFLPYPDATFEMFLRHDQEHTIIGVSFYN